MSKTVSEKVKNRILELFKKNNAELLSFEKGRIVKYRYPCGNESHKDMVILYVLYIKYFFILSKCLLQYQKRLNPTYIQSERLIGIFNIQVFTSDLFLSFK